ncbi:MAG: SUF system Fe-S cluster assembly regulator [Sandaracinus sp.]|nr:SUF system Fe-S cluster assembly regulator [Sandaracinus sp.]MCB9621611.1 SUF system Fe-S cluster assembly regulator [Sandaracinus sp.]
MLRISKLTDYGVVLATQLASADGPSSAAQLGEATGIPLPTVSKVLKALAKAGVVTATRGARGGYALTKGPHETNVAEVIAALEGPIAVTECTDDSTDACSHEPTCGVRTNWQRINLAVQHALESIDLAEMAAASQPPLVQLARSRREATARRVPSEPTVERAERTVAERTVDEANPTAERTSRPDGSRPEAPTRADESVSP